MNLKVLLGITITFCAGFATAQDPKFSKKSWLSDFEQLKEIINKTYPNLESALEKNKLSLYELNNETKRQLQKVNSDTDALLVLKDFVGRFKDGHFYLDANGLNTESQPITDPPLTSSTPGTRACSQTLNAKSKNIFFQFPTPPEMGFDEVNSQGSAFAFTTLLIGKRKVGFIRIASFLQGSYPELCAQEWDAFKSSIKISCDDKCQDKFIYEVLTNRLLHEFDETLKRLNTKDISALVLDITNNGGGSDWVAAIMRMLTSKPIICGQFGFIRHPHWVKHFQDEKSELLTAAKTISEFDQREKILELNTNLNEAGKKCDRSSAWTKKNYKPTCSLVVKKPVLNCPPNENFHFNAGAYQGPLFVLVNNGTASASEDLVGRYKDSGIATIIGERTKGSGCGFTNGGIKLKLKNSGIQVRMADCARFLKNGTNEVEGIMPDTELPMQNLKSEEFTSQLKNYLSQALNRL